ncbi:MAG: hypothetical protein M0Z99_01970 [Betaproteobacteria bacterium]|nr:hypothetical protein [Betaproteobacteria bacterium]
MNTSNASEIIERLGGTNAVARLCQVKPPSVSEWKTNGIPRARLMFLQAVRPDAFAEQPNLVAVQR